MVIFYSYVKLPEGSPKGLPMMCTKWKPFSYTCFYRAFFFSETSTVWHSYERRTSREAAVCTQTTDRKHWKSFTCLFFSDWFHPPAPQLSYQRKFNPPRAFKRTAFNAAISACSKASAWAAAFSLFHDMVPGSLRADWIREMCGLITAVLVLSALLIFLLPYLRGAVPLEQVM